MRHHRRRRRWLFVPIVLIAVTLLAVLVMVLWNALLPALFGLHALGFWQALGLLLLSRILFGRFGHPGGGWHFGARHMGQHWAQLSEQEREQLRAHWRDGCGPGGRGASEAPAAGP